MSELPEFGTKISNHVWGKGVILGWYDDKHAFVKFPFGTRLIYLAQGIMLETPDERVKLLKKGFTDKAIENLYILSNKFKIVHTPILYETVEFPDWEVGNAERPE